MAVLWVKEIIKYICILLFLHQRKKFQRILGILYSMYCKTATSKIKEAQSQKFPVCRYEERGMWIDNFKFPVRKGYASLGRLVHDEEWDP